MNLNNSPTKEQLRELLRRGDDDAGHNMLWVNKGGDVILSRLPKVWPAVEPLDLLPDMQMRVETFLAGHGYVGEEAAEDEEWVADLFDMLMAKWGVSQGKPDVAFVGPL
ncbi:MAG: hypothetical protein U0797_04210 [Gemmataceae bacterium]